MFFNKKILLLVLLLLVSVSASAQVSFSFEEQPIERSFVSVLSSEQKPVGGNVVFDFPDENELIDISVEFPELIINTKIEDLNYLTRIDGNNVVLNGFFGEEKVLFGSLDNDENILAEGFGANVKFCSNQPTGSTCTELSNNCNEIMDTPSFQPFWVYQEQHGVVHPTSPSYDYFVRFDAKFPNGSDVCWGSSCDDFVQNNYSGNLGFFEGYPYICTLKNFSLSNASGKWLFDFYLFDNLTGQSDTYFKSINVDLSEQCSIVPDTAWHSKESYTCNESIVTNHRFTNNGAFPVNYSIFFEVFDPNGYRIQTGSSSGSLNPSNAFTKEVISPPSGNWLSPGYYKVRATMTADCGINDDIESTWTWAYVPVSPCQQGDIVTVNSYPAKPSFSCSEDLQSKHEFANTGSYDFGYTLFNDVFDPDGYLIASGSMPDQFLEAGKGVTWTITDPVENFGNWTKSGYYKNRLRLEGQFSNGLPDSVSSDVLMNVLVACSGDEINGFDGNTGGLSFLCDQTIATQGHRFENTSRFYPFGYDFFAELYSPSGQLLASGSDYGNILFSQTSHVWRTEFSAPLGGWPEKGIYAVKTFISGAFEDGRSRSAESFAFASVPSAPCSTCIAVSDSAWIEQDGLCNDPIISKHGFVNAATENIPYNIDFFLFDPSNNLISQGSSSYTLETGYSNTWTVDWDAPTDGWNSGTYTARASLGGTCTSGFSTSASNNAFPVIPSNCDSATCNGVINVTVKNNFSNPIQNAEIRLDGSLNGSTDSLGKRVVSTSDASCGVSHEISVYCSNGTFCGSKSTPINFDGDNDPLNFTCSVCTQNQSLLVVASANSSYSLNDAIELEISVRDSSNNLVDSVVLAIFDPFAGITLQRLTTNGHYTYSTVASKTGTQTFNITASKNGYNNATTNKSVSVSQQNATIIVDVDDLDGNPVVGAKVYLDNEFKGDTDPNGKKTLNTQTGNHLVKVHCPNNNFCAEKNISVLGNHSAYFDCDCQFSLRVDTDNVQNIPLANVYIFLDGEENKEAGITNAFGYSLIENIEYGNHDIRVYFKLPEDEGGQIYYQTKSVFVDANPAVLEFVLSQNNSVKYSLTSSNDKNFSSQAIPVIVAVAVYAIVDVVSIGLDIDELCSCMYQNSRTQDFGLTECTSTINTCLQSGMESEICVDRVRNTNANLDNCPLEYGALGFDLGVGTGAGIAAKAGKLAVVTGVAGSGKKILQILDDSIKVITKWGDDVAIYVKNGLDWIGTWLSDVLKFKKLIKTPLGPLSELASEGAEIVGKKAGVKAQGILISEGTEKVGKELLENGLEGIAKLEAREVKGVDKLANKIGESVTAKGGVNSGNLKGWLANAEIAARPEYVGDVAEVVKDITVLGIGKGDIDILLKNGKIIEAKNSIKLSTMTQKTELDAFREQIRKLGVYQKQSGIAEGVEVVSILGFSDEAINELQKLINAGYDITWRSLQ